MLGDFSEHRELFLGYNGWVYGIHPILNYAERRRLRFSFLPWMIVHRGLQLRWLERTPDKREVGSSTLPRPTKKSGCAVHLSLLQSRVICVMCASCLHQGPQLSWESGSFASFRSSVRSRLAPPSYKLRIIPAKTLGRCGCNLYGDAHGQKEQSLSLK